METKRICIICEAMISDLEMSEFSGHAGLLSPCCKTCLNPNLIDKSLGEIVAESLMDKLNEKIVSDDLEGIQRIKALLKYHIKWLFENQPYLSTLISDIEKLIKGQKLIMNYKPRHKVLELMRVGDSIPFDCSQWQVRSSISQFKNRYTKKHLKKCTWEFTTKKCILVDPLQPENSIEVSVTTRIA